MSVRKHNADSVQQILEDYSSQLAHLAKELEQLQKDFKEWNDGRPDVTRSIGRA